MGHSCPRRSSHVFDSLIDALIGYLSAVGGPNYDQRGLWPADLHIVGKEIIRFHAVYWPAFLMAGWIYLYSATWAHGWLPFDSEKMSKSREMVRPRPIVSALGIEPLRYYLLRVGDRIRKMQLFLRCAGHAVQQRISRTDSDKTWPVALTMIERILARNSEARAEAG